MSKVATLAPKPNVREEFRLASIEILRDRLAQAEAGDVASVVVIVKHMDGTWSDDRAGTDTFPEAIGRLEIVKQAWINSYLRELK